VRNDFFNQKYKILKTKTGLDEFPLWADEIIKCPEDLPNFRFYYEKIETKSRVQNVSLSKVIGTTHQSYYHGSWKDMLVNLHREFVPNIKAAYLSIDTENNPNRMISFSKYDDLYFIDGDGNHRTCLAKYGSRKSVRARVRHFEFDVELFAAEQYLMQYFEEDSRFPDTYQSHLLSLILPSRSAIIYFVEYFKALPLVTWKERVLNWIDTSLKLKSKEFFRWPDSNDPSTMADQKTFLFMLKCLKYYKAREKD